MRGRERDREIKREEIGVEGVSPPKYQTSGRGIERENDSVRGRARKRQRGYKECSFSFCVSPKKWMYGVKKDERRI